MGEDLDDLPEISSPLVIIRGGSPGEIWIPVVHRQGQWIPLFPRYFLPSGSKQECLDRVRIKLGADKVFKRRWWGWHFAAASIHDQVSNR